jgi:hypothetical protein
MMGADCDAHRAKMMTILVDSRCLMKQPVVSL